MDFIEDYFYIIILIVGAIVQWLKSRAGSEEPKEYRKDAAPYDPSELEEFIEEAERRAPRAAVPPPLPPQGGPLPGVGRSPVPDLRRKGPPPLQQSAASLDLSAELERQQALMEQAREFKRAKSARKSKEVKVKGARPISEAPSFSIRGRLHSRSEIRGAFVLKEILDKPVGLR